MISCSLPRCSFCLKFFKFRINKYEMYSFNIVPPAIETSFVSADSLSAQYLVTETITSQPVSEPSVWTFNPPGGGQSPRNYLGLEGGSSNLAGNLDMSPKTGEQHFPSGAGVWNYGIIFSEPPGGENVQMRVVVTPGNVEASNFQWWVSDSSTSISNYNPTQDTMPAELAEKASKPNSGFILHIQNQSGSSISNPNFNYIVMTHSKSWI